VCFQSFQAKSKSNAHSYSGVSRSDSEAHKIREDKVDHNMQADAYKVPFAECKKNGKTFADKERC
jgi:hypothetical protein